MTRRRLSLLVLALIASLIGADVATAGGAILSPPAYGAPVNAKTLDVVAVVDGKAVVRVDGRRVGMIVAPCRGGVGQRSIDVSALEDGLHVLSVAGRRVAFTIDRSAAVPERNRIEAAATPAQLACLSRKSLVLAEGRAIGPGERIVVSSARGTTVKTARALGLRRVGSRRYVFRPISGAFSLRVGNDWGAIDARGVRVAAPATSLDGKRAHEALIGPAGGRIETIDSAGVRVLLEIPAGALTRETRIRVSPVVGPPLAGGAGSAGLRFEPDGLVFARPVALTLDYSRLERLPDGWDTVALVTSPMTALPLPATTDSARRTITALLPHFSTTAAGISEEAFSDLAAWADPILRSSNIPTLGEIRSLLELVEMQQRQGCVDGCISPALVTAKVDLAMTGLSSEACLLDVASPSRAALTQWLTLGQVARSLGSSSTAARDCAEGVLRAMILDLAGAAGSQSDGDLETLAAYASEAESLAFPALRLLALRGYAGIIRGRLSGDAAHCRIDPVSARERLEALKLPAEPAQPVDPSLLATIQETIDSCDRATTPAPSAAPAPAPPAAPAPVLALECAGDVSAPTDAAVDRWRLVEIAGPSGADVSAVRACIASIFGALIAQATSAAGAAPTDLQLERFREISAHALLVSAPASSADALRALDSRLRALLGTIASVCSGDAAAGLVLANRIAGWASSVASVDSSLGADANAAAVSCVPLKPLDAFVWGTRDPLYPNSPGENATAVRWSGFPVVWSEMGRDGAVPQSFTAIGSGQSVSLSITSPQRNVIAIDFDDRAARAYMVQVAIRLTATVAGTLSGSFNASEPLSVTEPSSFYQGIGARGGDDFSSIFNVSAADLPYGRFDSAVGRLPWSRPMAAGETIEYRLRLTQYPAAGRQGRLVTIRLD